VAQKLYEFKKTCKMPIGSNRSDINVGIKWYNAFMKRHSSVIKTVAPKNVDQKRKSFMRKDLFNDMYNNVYALMKEAGVVEELPEEVMLDIDGNIVDDEAQMYGFPTRYRVTDPDNIVFLMRLAATQTRKKIVELAARK
jgi:hypothetical protein